VQTRSVRARRTRRARSRLVAEVVPAAGLLPGSAVHGDLGYAAGRWRGVADHPPAGREFHVPGEGRDDRVVLAAAEHPVHRVDADGLPDVGHLGGYVDVRGPQVDVDAAGHGDV